jgi:nitroimidazol reductase NimA-like FMN-containing flavoprotein (pyridoxamine 5'-phosphate oxidase superfamily)
VAKKYTKKEILKFLRDVSIMSAAVNAGNYPVSTILLFSVDDDFTFYFAARGDSFKAKALKVDPRISIAVWEHDRMLVQACGDVEQVTQPKELDLALDKLASSVANVSDFWPPILRISGGDYYVYKVTMKWVRALDLKSKVIKEEDSSFTEYNL